VWVAQAELLAATGDAVAARQLLDRACATFEELRTVDGPDRARKLLATLGG
jgi:hypothetical protein